MNLIRRRPGAALIDASPADAAGLAAVIGPAAIEVRPRYVHTGDGRRTGTASSTPDRTRTLCTPRGADACTGWSPIRRPHRG